MPPATLSATGKKQEIAPIATLEPGPTPNHMIMIGKKMIFGHRPEIVEIGLVGARHELRAAEHDADREPGDAADHHARCRSRRTVVYEVEIERRIAQRQRTAHLPIATSDGTTSR